MVDFDLIEGYEWDQGNAHKSASKHGVSQAESEQIFLNRPLIVAEDDHHSLHEARYHALGKTDMGRRVHVTFTLRGGGKLIRVISARDMSRKEKGRYDQDDQEDA